MALDFMKYLKKISGLKGLATIGMSDIIGGGLTAVFWFFLASQLDTDVYGEIHYYLGIAGLAQIISLIANSNVITVYVAKKIKLISTLFFISLVIGSFSSLMIIILFTRIDASLLVLTYIMVELSNGVLLGKKLFKKYSLFMFIQKALTLVLGIGFYFIFGEIGIIFALVLSYLHYLIIVMKELRTEKIDFSLLKQKKDFIINNYLMNLSGSFSGQIDKMIIAPLLGFTLLGNYALALQFFVVLMIFPNIMYKFILTHDSSGNENKNLKKISLVCSILIAILSFTILPVIIPELFPKYIQTIDAIQIISFAVIPGTIVILYTSKFLASEKSKYVLMSKIFSNIILIIGFITLGPIFGIVGLSTILLIVISIEAIFLFLINKFKEI